MVLLVGIISPINITFLFIYSTNSSYACTHIAITFGIIIYIGVSYIHNLLNTSLRFLITSFLPK